MPSYRVTWEIDVEADDEVSAAREARRYQLREDAIVGIFDVVSKDGRSSRVDLDELDGRLDDLDEPEGRRGRLEAGTGVDK